MFSVVFMFLRFGFEGAGLLSSPQPGEQSCSERNASKPAFRAGGRRSEKQYSDTKIRGAKLPRSNQKRVKPADEHGRNHSLITADSSKQAFKFASETFAANMIWSRRDESELICLCRISSVNDHCHFSPAVAPSLCAKSKTNSNSTWVFRNS